RATSACQPASRHPRPPDLEGTCPWRAAWLSRFAQARRRRLAGIDLAALREQPACEILHADHGLDDGTWVRRPRNGTGLLSRWLVRLRHNGMRLRSCFAATLLLTVIGQAQQQTQPPPFTLDEVMIPMRDGARLQTVVLTPTSRTGSLPILLRRTPYGVPEQPPAQIPAGIKD